MSTVAQVVSIALMAGGSFFLLVSTVGLIRLPDFFSRSHAVGKSETLGSLLFLAGLGVYNGWALESAKLVLILIFVAATNPSGIHVLTRAALRKGLDIWVAPEDRPATAATEAATGPKTETAARSRREES
jgi:multicomponent Na+:H+ antiporter subunit G